jgi:hypothetical protein
MAKFTKGQVVTLATVLPSGPVTAMRFNDDAEVECLIEWVDAEGNAQQRWFLESDLVAA